MPGVSSETIDNDKEHGPFYIPQSLKLEHEELHAELAEATKVEGRIGDAERLLQDFAPAFSEGGRICVTAC